MQPESTEDLIDRAKDRDRRALEELLVRNLSGLEGYLRLRMGPVLRSKESGADLVQSVCREVLRDLSTFEFRGEAAFRHWLYTRARHKLLHKRRDLSAQQRDVEREQPFAGDSRDAALLSAYRGVCTPSADLAAREAVARIEAAFDALPDDHKEAITLHRLVGLGHKEIAEQLGRSEGAVRNLVYRGLARLAMALEQ